MNIQNKQLFDTIKEEAYDVWRRLDPEKTGQKIKELETESSTPDFWNDKNRAETLFKQLNEIKETYIPWKDLIQEIDDIDELISLYRDSEDEDAQSEIEQSIENVEKRYKPLRLKTLLSGKFDKNECFLSVHAGAGGTEACDWAQMLMRMYLRWCERNGFKVDIVDLLEAEGGVKSVTMQVKGSYAYGYLQGEAGVHRLVRISPFDSNKRRHTSFTSVYASPVIEDEVEINIDPSELRIDTYRAGGAGGQHVNKTDSAVRITHLKTGLVVACQNERSQHMNKALAMKILTSRLYEYYREEQEKDHAQYAVEKKDISWGNQIRSYVFQPYTMVKDHRTGEQIGNIQAVMDGDISQFIESYLKWASQV
ncbi:MAG: peptide chain release factor 2 [Sphaerochaetaceae bacterium]|nr:peptide chain release factor 2 [Sphaerochaetaceae bacterium]